MQPILRVEGLAKTYTRRGAEVPALRGIDFSLMPGECLGLVGPSGSGKSTILRLIARLEEPTAGRILLDGEDITRLHGRALRPVWRKMQMVFQNPAASFDPRRTLGDGIAEGLRNAGFTRRQAQAETEALLARCGLPPELAARYPHQVSGGQCQRAAIARAVALRPGVLLCDEVTSALDAPLRGEIVALMRELQRDAAQPMAILFVSHDLTLVGQFCDRTIYLRDGRLESPAAPHRGNP